jgi:hypothetical protein
MANVPVDKIEAANTAAKNSIITNIKDDFNLIKDFLLIPEITYDIIAIVIQPYLNEYKKKKKYDIITIVNHINYEIKSIIDKLTPIKVLSRITTNLTIKVFYNITKIIVKHLKEFKIIFNKKNEYEDINTDIKSITEALLAKTEPSRDTMLAPWSNIHFDILLLYLGKHTKIIDNINERIFFDYDDFVKFTNVFGDRFKFIYYDRWELSNLSLFNLEEYSNVLIHKNTKYELVYDRAFEIYDITSNNSNPMLLIESHLLSDSGPSLRDLEFDGLYLEMLKKYITNMNKLNEERLNIHSTIIKIINLDKLKNLDELDELDEKIKRYLLNLNSISKLTERRNKLFSQDNKVRVEINITEELDKLKKILETMSTGVSLIRYNIMDEGKKTKSTSGGSNTRKKIKQCHNFIKDFTNYIP